MFGSEKQAAPDGLDRRLMREYGPRYLEVQRLILGELPAEKEREDWATRYGQAFHDLAAIDRSFHELVMSARPDIPEIRRRVEEYGDNLAAGAEPKMNESK